MNSGNYTRSSKNKLNRHATAFAIIMLASIFLYPAAQVGSAPFTLLLLGLVVLSALLVLMTK
jgi:hypothetical protein